MQKFKIKIADYFIVGFIIMLGTLGLWFNLQEVGAAGNKYARIYVENRQVAELSLARGDSFNYMIEFGDDNQHNAVVEVKDGRIRMLPISEELCPRGICSHTGWIEDHYEKIVCLPNQIMIVFDHSGTESNDQDIDGITY